MQSFWSVFLEKLWSKDGLLPPLEHNQGLLTLLALVVVLIAFALQAGRARKAEARAAKIERDRKREAEAADFERRQHEETSRAREKVALEDAEKARRASQMRQFVGAAGGLMGGVRDALLADQQRAEADRSVDLARPTPIAKRQAAIAASSLTAILPSAPMNPGLIATTREAALVLEILANTPPMQGAQGDAVAADFSRLLTGAQMTLAHHERTLLNEMGLAGVEVTFVDERPSAPAPAPVEAVQAPPPAEASAPIEATAQPERPREPTRPGQ